MTQGEVRDLILEIFDLTPGDAERKAAGLISLAHGWGDARNAGKLDWRYLVKKRLGQDCKWRNESERENFEFDLRLSVESYENYIRKHKRG